MVWEVEYTNEFGMWWHELSERQQDAVAARVDLLTERGPHLSYPYSSDINGSRMESCANFEHRWAAIF